VASRISDLKAAINALLETVDADGVSYAEVIGTPFPVAFPASTIMLTEATQEDFATGGITQNEWRFLQQSWVDYSGDREQAILELELLIEAIPKAIRDASPDDLTLPDGTDFELVLEPGGDPEDAPAETVYFKSFYIVARTEET
jgi:hypothetical protein